MKPKLSKLLILLVLLVIGLPQQGRGYSILTHEEIIDLLWADQIAPLLKHRFPQASDEDLRKAHAYAYGGCLIQDMGYYPFGNKFFSDLVHYVRSGDFVRAMLSQAQDINEYAFALGALAHYSADVVGHPVVNAAVAREFPELKKKYGPIVTYAQDKKAHIRTEFGFDVVQVAKQRYTSDTYHNFVGFEVSKPVLERAFLETYGMKLDDIFTNLDLSLGSFRHSVSHIIPEMTRVALLTKKDEMVKENPSFTRKKFLYNLSRTDYEREWGKQYQRPGFGAKLLAFIFRLVPKVGPFKAIDFKMPYPDTETLYLKSVNDTLDRYRTLLKETAQGGPALANLDFDTGKATRPGEYRLTDEAYARLLDKLAEHNFAGTPPELRHNILTFYSDAQAPNSMRRKPDRWERTLREVQEMKSSQTTADLEHK